MRPLRHLQNGCLQDVKIIVFFMFSVYVTVWFYVHNTQIPYT